MNLTGRSLISSLIFLLLSRESKTFKPKPVPHIRKCGLNFESRPSIRCSTALPSSGHSVANESPSPIVPKTSELLNFCIPTLGIWLLQPILSLVDSSIVGISASSKASSVIELAALGPGIIWCDGTAYLLQFLGMATTNLFALALSDRDRKKQFAVLSEAVTIAGFLGLSLGTLQYQLAKPVLTILSGASAADIVPVGVDYVRIRSLGAPMALLTIVAQAAFLASKDAVTPLRAVLFGTIINLVGDIVLVLGCRLGLVGAAVATMLSQVFGGLYLIYIAFKILQKQTQLNDYTNSYQDNPYPKPILSKIKNFFDKVKYYYTPPKASDLIKFASFAGPIFFVLFSKQTLWTYATMCASVSGTVALAAHQVVINFYIFFCIFGDSISQTAQTYLPGMLIPLHSESPTTNASVISRNLGIDNAKEGNSSMSVNESKVTGVSVLNTSNNSNQKFSTQMDTSLSSSNNDNNNDSFLISKQTPSLWKLEQRKNIRLLLNRILGIGLGAGVINSVFSLALPVFTPQLFTKSEAVIRVMRTILPFLSLCLLPHCLMSAMEGILIASDNTMYLSFGYLFTGICFIAIQMFVRAQGYGIRGVWYCLFIYQYLRLIVFGSKVWHEFYSKNS